MGCLSLDSTIALFLDLSSKYIAVQFFVSFVDVLQSWIVTLHWAPFIMGDFFLKLTQLLQVDGSSALFWVLLILSALNSSFCGIAIDRLKI